MGSVKPSEKFPDEGNSKEYLKWKQAELKVNTATTMLTKWEFLNTEKFSNPSVVLPKTIKYIL